MKKKVLLLAMLTTTITFAQKTSFGLKMGINSAKITEAENPENRIGFVGGFYINAPLNNKFSFQPEIIYSAQGVKERSPYVAQDVSGIGNVELFGVEVLNKLDYVFVPLMFQFKLIDEFYLQAGPQIGILISAKQKATASNMLINNNPIIPTASEVDIKDQINFVDFGVNFGIGYKTKVGLNFDARYNLGSNEIELLKSSGSNQHRVWQFAIGYDIIKNKTE